MFDVVGRRVFIAGHGGLVGASVLKKLQMLECDLLTLPRLQLDLRLQSETDQWIGDAKPDVIIMAAAKVGGLGANAEYPADFLYDNLAIEQNIIHAAYKHKVSKLLFLGSSCIYPKFAEQPIQEEALLTGELEPTNEAYAIAKIAGIKLCHFYRRQYGCDFISLMPCNLYGPGDRWNQAGAHVIPSLMGRIHQAKISGKPEVEIWGSGTPLREFLYVDDLAEGILCALKYYSGELHLNIGSGEEIAIGDLALKLKSIIGYEGELIFDSSKPDGTPRKILNSDRIRSLGWVPKIGLEKGLRFSYLDFLKDRNRI